MKVFGKWGSAVAEAMAGQGGEENLFSKRFLPHKTVLQHPLISKLMNKLMYSRFADVALG